MSTASDSKRLLAVLGPRVCSSTVVYINTFISPSLICTAEGSLGAPRSRWSADLYTKKSCYYSSLLLWSYYLSLQRFKSFTWAKGELFKGRINNPLVKSYLIFIEILDMLLKAVSLNPGIYMCRYRDIYNFIYIYICYMGIYKFHKYLMYVYIVYIQFIFIHLHIFFHFLFKF